jgi:hypothetical protein
MKAARAHFDLGADAAAIRDSRRQPDAQRSVPVSTVVAPDAETASREECGNVGVAIAVEIACRNG